MTDVAPAAAAAASSSFLPQRTVWPKVTILDIGVDVTAYHERVTEPGLPAILASDAEREQTCEVLRLASVDGRLTLDEFSVRIERALASRSRAELQAITADLPPVPAGVPPPSVLQARAGRVPRSAIRWSVAIMSGVNRKGFWRIDEESKALAVMGSCKLDLRGAAITAPVTTIEARAIMGSIDVIVPFGVEVELDGIAIMGSKNQKLTGPPPHPGAPVVRIEAFALMGEITVRDRATLGERLRNAIDGAFGGGDAQQTPPPQTTLPPSS
jgi:Domain of unknown function (DUF1707)/Cell wall-active antibiotics response 4TMS YvqF